MSSALESLPLSGYRASPGECAAAWTGLEQVLASLLLDAGEDPQRVERIHALAERLRARLDVAPDAALFVLFQRASRMSENYGVAHALRCAAVCELVAVQLDWPGEERRALLHAALTMNIAITELQSDLAHRERPLTGDQRRALSEHPQRSARLLQAAGVGDRLWLEVVERHHERCDPELPLSALGPAQRLAEVLRRIDVFLAKLSPRVSRATMSVTAATREACLGANGRPDQIGGAILRVLGFYPPGTGVRLASGEIGIVLRRGVRADHPVVACVMDTQRKWLSVPCRRYTHGEAHRVVVALGTDTLRPHPVFDLLFEMVGSEESPAAQEAASAVSARVA